MEDFAEPCVFVKQSPPPILCPPPRLASERGPLIPKLRGQFAEFLQHHSLKRLSILSSSTCVGLGYGLYAGAISWKQAERLRNPLTENIGTHSVTTSRLRNINRIPIDYAFRPRLRDRLTLRGLTLHRNPWTYGGSVFHTPCRYSCQHSHFRYLHVLFRVTLHRLTERSATTQRTERRYQGSEFFWPDFLCKP